MIGFVLTYLTVIAFIVGGMCAFFTTIAVRNRLVTAIAAFWNIAANPLATVTNYIKTCSAATFAAIPETAFANGVVHRIVYLVSLAVLGAADFALAEGRLGPAFGVDSAALPFDITWTTALAWVGTSGFFAAMSLELRMEPVSHPWDQLAESRHVLCRRISDTLLGATLVSAVGFYVFGALAVTGIYATFLAIAFMGILGLTLTAAAAIAFWASLHAWATLLGLILGAAGFSLRLVALATEAVVIVLRHLGYLCMAVADIPFLGVAWPLVRWWASSRLGKSIGHAPVEQPIPWPAIGFFEETHKLAWQVEESAEDQGLGNLGTRVESPWPPSAAEVREDAA